MMYYFRREDNGAIIEVSFEQMMTKDIVGCITLEDGVVARQCVGPSVEKKADKKESNTGSYWATGHVSDAMGFHPSQLADFEADRKANGFTGVEFRKDPNGHMMQAVFSCKKEFDRYMRHRGLIDKNGSTRSKVILSKEDFEKARLLVEGAHNA